LAGLLLPLLLLLRRSQEPPPWKALRSGWLAFLPALLIGLLSLDFAFARPVWNVDAQTRWVYHGQWLAEYGTVLPARMEDPSWALHHPRYPPLVPGAVGLTLELGADKDLGVRPLFPFFFLALLGVVFGCGCRRRGAVLAGLASFALAVVPCFGWLPSLEHSLGLGADAALADVPLALFLTAFAVLLLEGLRGSGRGAFPLAAWMGAGALLTKQEGGVLALLFLLVAWLWTRRTPREPGFRPRLLGPGVFLLAVLLFWKAVSARMPVSPGENYLSAEGLHGLFTQLDRVPAVLSRLANEWFRLPVWGLLWFLPFLAGILWIGQGSRRIPWRLEEGGKLLLAWLLAGNAMVVVAYTATGWKDGAFEGLMEFSLTRLLMHLAPLVILLLFHLEARPARS
ncbi:MAG: hypothetical protein ACE5H3_10265, partial [Planctomycetota bacterium]